MKNSLKYVFLCTFVILSVSCSSGGSHRKNLNLDNVTLIAGQSVKLVYDGDCSWHSDEPLIAEVDNNGNVTANRIGNTLIWANNESCNVTVTPKYNTYIDPCLHWGATELDIREYMKDFTYSGEYDNFLIFEDSYREILYMYSLKNNSLQGSIVGASMISKGEEIIDFLLERYVLVSTSDSDFIAYLVSIDKKIVIGVKLDANTGLIMVLYAPYVNDKSLSSIKIPMCKSQEQCNISDNEIKELFSKFKK